MSEENKTQIDGIDTYAVAEKMAKVAISLLDQEDPTNLANETTLAKVKELFTPEEMAYLAMRFIVRKSIEQMASDPIGFACAAMGLKIKEEKDNG